MMMMMTTTTGTCKKVLVAKTTLFSAVFEIIYKQESPAIAD